MIPNQFNRLLEMAVSSTAPATNSGENADQQMRPLTEEDKNFLSAAMDSLCSDYIKILKDCIATLEVNAKTTHNERVVAFQELLNHCDHLDVARDFEKLGGFRILYPYVDKVFTDGEFCLKEGIFALDVLSMCCQLNDYCQDRAIENNLLSRSESLLDESLQKLASLASPTTADVAIGPLRVAFKTLSVLSAIVRGSEAAISSFLHVENGKCLDQNAAAKTMTMLMAALGVGDMKVDFDDETYDDAERALPRRIRTKAAFLLRSLVNKEESAPEDAKASVSPCDAAMTVAVEVGAVEKLLQVITNARHGSEAADYEHILNLLAWLPENSSDAGVRLRSSVSKVVKRQLLDWKETAKEDNDEEMAKTCDKILRYTKK